MSELKTERKLKTNHELLTIALEIERLSSKSLKTQSLRKLDKIKLLSTKLAEHLMDIEESRG